MWAHDLEKHQHLFASGELKPEKVGATTLQYECSDMSLQVYVSKTAQIPASDVPGLSGAFPGKAPPLAQEPSPAYTEPRRRRVPPKPDL